MLIVVPAAALATAHDMLSSMAGYGLLALTVAAPVDAWFVSRRAAEGFPGSPGTP